VLWGLCFGVRPLPWLAPFAPLALFGLLGRRAPFRLGLVQGAVTWVVALPWIVSTLTTYGQLDGWFAALLLLLLGLYLGLYTALFAWLGARLWRCGDLLSLAALPALWVSLELQRGWLITGFPWNLAAYAWLEVPGALPLAAWVGAWGVSYLALVPALGGARALAARRWEPAALALLLPAALLPMAGRWAVPATGAGHPLREARLLQPDIPALPVFDAARIEADYQRLIERARAACQPDGLLIWPESAAWPYSWPRDARLAADLAELGQRGCTTLFNTPTESGGRTFNSAVLLAPDGASQRYDKRHLVPFGEYVPLAGALPWLGRIARNAGDFAPAEEIRLLAWNGERLGAAICYEVVFPGEVAALSRAGATVLVTVTNDSWYGDSSAPWQHLAAARFRAAENRRWLLRAAITGVSAVVRPDGSLASSLGVGEEGTLEARFQGRADLSPFARAPWLVPAACALLALAGLVRARRPPQ
jgi:apolipoprotein N-acyltransferase